MASKVAQVSLLSATTKAPPPKSHLGYPKFYKKMASQRRSGKANKLSQGSMPDLSNHLFWWVMSFLGHKKLVDSFPVNRIKKFNLGL